MVKNKFSNVILGTAQLGLNYGISNKNGPPSNKQANDLLSYAASQGVALLDTAQAYGASEDVIGDYSKTRFEVQTKVGRFPESDQDFGEWLVSRVERSRERISDHNLKTVFFHDPSQFHGELQSRSISAIQHLRQVFPALEIGASIYDPSEWQHLREIEEISTYQVPYSILDRRFERNGIIREVVDSGKSVQARSIYLQGLLLMNLNQVPKYFQRWLPVIESFHAFCTKNKIAPIAAASNFVLSNPLFSGVLMGFNRKEEFQELIYESILIEGSLIQYPDFGEQDPELLDPRIWKTN
jgi:aryl-alcohol dehydrogenase-like predicted oxidoreductase